MHRKSKIGLALVAVCALVGLTAALADAGKTTQKASTASTGKTSAKPPAGLRGGPGGPGPDGDRGAVHSVSVVLNKSQNGYVTQTSDRGTIKSVDTGASTIDVVEGIKSVTYQTVTLTIPSGATVLLDGKSSSPGSLAAGDEVNVTSSSEGTTVFATDSSFHPEGGPGGGWPASGMPPRGAPGSPPAG